MAYAFGPFRYDADQRLLFRGSEVVPLVPKVVETLHALLERRGRIVEKNELIKLVWPDTVVEEGGLARNISLLRKALGEEEGEAPYIETIPRRGYRFIAEVANPEPAVRRRPPLLYATLGLPLLAILIYWQFYRPSRYLPSEAGRAELAVAAFQGDNPAQTFQHLLTAELARFPHIQVLSPGTVSRYRKLGIPMVWMARILNLDLVLDGSLNSAPGGTRVTAFLSDVHSGKLVWAENLDVEEFHNNHREIARRIAQEVAAQLAKK